MDEIDPHSSNEPGKSLYKFESRQPMPGAFDVFQLREQPIGDYSQYLKSFLHILDGRLLEMVDGILAGGALLPDPLVQMNPAFESGGYALELVAQGVMHPKSGQIFSHKSDDPVVTPCKMRLKHPQTDAIRAAPINQGSASFACAKVCCRARSDFRYVPCSASGAKPLHGPRSRS